ncbi:MAG: hypothetical protein C0524_16955 [Rhodobacter sp.]|nr:hypothetical protein [Rhodobacter sp.]
MVAGGVTVEMRDGIAVLTLDHAPSNALSPTVRAGLLAALQGLADDCRAVVIGASGSNFSSALPLEPDTAAPPLAEVCAAFAQSPVPVVAALHGLVLGPGAELALAATARIAAPGCRIALPEIALGLCPEGGTTWRLPALVGAAAALRLLLTGRAVPVDEALALGLVDAVAEGPLMTEALRLAGRLAVIPLVRNAAEAPAAYQAAIAASRRAHPRALPAVGRIIDCVEAAQLLPPEAAQAFEAVAREDLESTAEATALRAAARAERRASALPPAVARARPLSIDRIALVGEAASLPTLARLAVAQGLHVHWLHPRPQSLAAEGLEGPTRLLHMTSDPADVAGAPLQIHATPPDATLQLEASPGAAVLVLQGAEGELGLTIAPSGRACELSVLAEEAPEAIATAIAGLRKLGLPPLLVGKRPVLGQRIVRAGEAALVHLAAQGVPQRHLAAALNAFGARLPEGLPEAETTPLDLPATEICNRWLGAMANEALRLLDQGIARRPSDVDHALVAGHDFPRWRGGPMHQADLRGLMVLRHDLRVWAADDPFWTPAPLLDRLIQDGLRLSALDR